MTTLQRLTGYPHAAVFDKAPHDLLAFRLRHPDGATWTIADAVMTARAGGGEWTFDLNALTVAQLAAGLADAGFEVSELSADFGALSALVLVEGDGDQGVSNGDRVTAYTSLLWVLMGGYAGVVREAGAQVLQALRQMVITQAEDEWLDLWGRLYGVARRQGEGDAPYAPRIPKEAFRLRESPIAIEEAVKDATGKTIRIEEPWGNVFRLDGSTLSGPDKFQDGVRVGYFLIQPTSTQPLDWSDVLPVIHRNRAAGVLVLPPLARNRSAVEAGIAGLVESGVTRTHMRQQRYEDRTLLDYSSIEDTPILNHASLRSEDRLHRSESVVEGWVDVIWPNAIWNDSPYYIESYYFRSYRVYNSALNYEDQYWLDSTWPETMWNDYNVVIGSSHYSVDADGLHTLVNTTLPADGYF